MVVKIDSNGDSEELIPAVAYLRKSTKGERKGRQKQEKSIAQQKAEIIKMARGRFEIVKWFEDEGISGWKRGAKRPDFQRMLEEVQSLGARAILCDHIDRFSRATYDDVQEDASGLRRAGVRWVVTASHGEYDLTAGRRNDIAAIIRFAADVWAAHEFSRNLSRRISRSRRDAAEDGKRTGGRAAYGLVDDGQGGYKPGDPAKSRVVVWLFEQFVNEVRSLSWLAGDLNRRKVLGPYGGKWYVRTVAALLRRRCYRGDFSYNEHPCGQFFRINADGEVVDRVELEEAKKKEGEEAKAKKTKAREGKVFITEGAYKPLVDPALFDRAQERLQRLSNPKQRKHLYALSGVLFCDHCGSKLYGMREHRTRTVLYRCGADGNLGRGSCGYRQVREDDILPFVLRTLGQEVKDLEAMLSRPPDEWVNPGKGQAEKREEAERKRAELATKIAGAMDAMQATKDARTRRDYDKRISAWRDELDRLDADLVPGPEAGDVITIRQENGEVAHVSREALLVFWKLNFKVGALSVPIPGDLPQVPGFQRDRAAEEEGRGKAVLVEPRKANDMLRQLGCEVRLRWEERRIKTKAGGERVLKPVVRGRFRLGQQQGRLSVGPEGVLLPSVSRRSRASSPR